jgi:signal recognition particle GTPase
MAKKPNGLYENINAKRQRIAEGSGEKMRRVGSEGAPTAKDFKESAKTAKMKSGGKASKSCW